MRAPATISVYNNLAACILATVKDNSTSNAEKEHEKVVKYTGMVYKKIKVFDKHQKSKKAFIKSVLYLFEKSE